MTRKIDPHVEPRPKEQGAPGTSPELPGRSEEDEARFVREGEEEAPADVTESQRDLERRIHRREPGGD